MPTRTEIATFTDPPPPEGASPWVVEPEPSTIEVVPSDPSWPALAESVVRRVRDALGARALQVTHVGSTAVPGLPAKPVVDLDLVVADPEREASWLPPLVGAGFVLTVREPWWHGHRLLRGTAPPTNLHVFGPDSPETWKHLVFRDWLRAHPADRDRYAAAKVAAAAPSAEQPETVMAYNERKEAVIHDIYARAFRAAGLVD